MTCKSSFCIGNACRYKVVGYLKKQFQTPRDAEDAYSGEQSADSNAEVEPPTIDSSTTEYHFSQLSAIVQLDLLSRLFSSYASRELKLSVPDDFVALAAKAMVQLKDNNHSNVLYNIAKVIGTIREDGSDSRFPIKRMPMGLVEYIASFFAADNLQSVSKGCCFMARNLLKFVCVHCTIDFMSHGLSPLATNHVLSLWPEVVYSASWPSVEYYTVSAKLWKTMP